MTTYEIDYNFYNLLSSKTTKVPHTEAILPYLEKLDKQLRHNQYNIYVDSDAPNTTLILSTEPRRYRAPLYFMTILEYTYVADPPFDIMETYRYNRFWINKTEYFDEMDFSFDSLPKSDLFTIPFAIITALNPHNELTLSRFNQNNNQSLHNWLKNSKHLFFTQALGYLGSHQEDSFCVFGISLNEACSLAKRFNQYSIFYNNTVLAGYYEAKNATPILVQKILFRDKLKPLYRLQKLIHYNNRLLTMLYRDSKSDDREISDILERIDCDCGYLPSTMAHYGLFMPSHESRQLAMENCYEAYKKRLKFYGFDNVTEKLLTIIARKHRIQTPRLLAKELVEISNNELYEYKNQDLLLTRILEHYYGDIEDNYERVCCLLCAMQMTGRYWWGDENKNYLRFLQNSELHTIEH